MDVGIRLVVAAMGMAMERAAAMTAQLAILDLSRIGMEALLSVSSDMATAAMMKFGAPTVDTAPGTVEGAGVGAGKTVAKVKEMGAGMAWLAWSGE